MLLLPAVVLPQGTAPSKFDVASIRANPACRNGRRPPATQSPGRWRTECSTLEDLIRMAYIAFADGVQPDPHADRVEIVEGPSWISSDYYAVNTKAEGAPRLPRILGPMARNLLEDRFKLKVHREQKEAAIYELVVAKKGLRAKPVKPGSCLTFDYSHPPAQRPAGDRAIPYCGSMTLAGTPANTEIDVVGVTMTEFASQLAIRMDRDVVDKTGTQGRFNLHFAFTADDATPGFGLGGPGLAPGLAGIFPQTQAVPPPSSTPAGPSIFNALQSQLGLRLRPARGDVGVLVVDHAERPSQDQ